MFRLRTNSKELTPTGIAGLRFSSISGTAACSRSRDSMSPQVITSLSPPHCCDVGPGKSWKRIRQSGSASPWDCARNRIIGSSLTSIIRFRRDMDELNQNCNPKTMNRKTKANNKAQIRRVRVNLIKLPFVICRVFLASGLVAAAMAPFFPTHAQEATASPSTGARDFDFLVGESRVHHRRLKPGSNEWVEFDGTLSNRPLMDGSANIEEHALNSPAGAYRAIGLRAYDTKDGQWAFWWLGGRDPARPIDQSKAKGRFEHGVGRFYSGYTQERKPTRGRSQW